MTQEEYLRFAEKQCSEIITLIRQKNADYTAGGSAFANFDKSTEWGIDPLHGLCLRVEDKLQRVKSYVRNGDLKVTNEGVEDAFRDLVGYSLIALGMLKEKKEDREDKEDTLNRELLLEAEAKQKASLLIEEIEEERKKAHTKQLRIMEDQYSEPDEEFSGEF